MIVEADLSEAGIDLPLCKFLAGDREQARSAVPPFAPRFADHPPRRGLSF